LSRIIPKCCCMSESVRPAIVPAAAPTVVMSHPSHINAEVTVRLDAPIARSVAMFCRFSIASRLRVDMMLNDAIRSMNMSMRNVTHFSTAIMR